MDTHPIPQNVTSFQFKLVGDMTLKQFLYLAAGVGTAYLLFVTLSASNPLIAWPLIVLFTLLGVSFAFVPIESRPLDYWLGAFLKAVYSPTKRAWKRGGRLPKEDSLFSSRLMIYLAGLNQNQVENQGVNSQTSINPAMLVQSPIAPAPSSQPAQLPTQQQLEKTVDLARQAQKLQMKIIETERTLSQIKAQTQKPSPIPVDYSQQVNKILSDLQNLITQASAVKQQIQSVQSPQQVKTENLPPAQPITREKVKVVVSPKPKQTQVALTTFPNVINGIVKDKLNNYLEGAVAVIYDKVGLPVRALKTNKLGQFTGSTPLPTGTYTLELEKEGFVFDVLQIELNGQVLPPIIITGK